MYQIPIELAPRIWELQQLQQLQPSFLLDWHAF
jgi:hypothetical protein